MTRVRTGVLGAAALGVALLGATALSAQDGREFGGRGPGGWGMHGAWSRFSPDDRQAFADARLAALRTGLKLTPDQEKFWPPVEEAIRNFGKVRREAFEARRARREAADRAPTDGLGDLPGRLRATADAQSTRADALRRLADATGPLYATLDDGQKRRAAILARPMGRWTRPMMDHGGPRGPRDR